MENLFCGILLDSYGNGCVDFFEKSFEKNFRKKVAKKFWPYHRKDLHLRYRNKTKCLTIKN